MVIEKLGLPKHRGAGRLAVVGGGPSIKDHIEELRNWDGAIWAVNGTINFCLDHGIDAWFYTADAMPPKAWAYDLSRIKKALVAPDVSPLMIEHLQSIGAHIELTSPIMSGPTSANASDYLSLELGYRNITYFGCEGAFEEAKTHAVESYPIPDWMVVDIRGEFFKTKMEFVSQSIMLANVIREFPHIYSEKSGGLLRAMVENGPEYDVYMVSNSLFAKLSDKEAA